MSLLTFFLGVYTIIVAVAAQSSSLTGIPSQTAASSSYTAPPTLLSHSQSFTFTVTTPTTYWQPPAFQTPYPLPVCSETMCSTTPTSNGQECVDVSGVVYGILCNTLLSGVVITNSGKYMEKEKRSYTGTFAGCIAFCDTYNKTSCAGVAYQGGNCLAYDQVTGTFPNPAGGFVGLRM